MRGKRCQVPFLNLTAGLTCGSAVCNERQLLRPRQTFDRRLALEGVAAVGLLLGIHDAEHFLGTGVVAPPFFFAACMLAESPRHVGRDARVERAIFA